MLARIKKTYQTFPFISSVLLAILFIIWATFFIRRSSFIAIDGNRYYSLFDDAMISMRYGWNLAHGYGPVWNPGQPPVEGYTNPLAVLLMAIPSMFLSKSMAVLAFQIGGIFIILATAFLATRVYWLVGSNINRPSGARLTWLVFAAVIAYYPLLHYTLLGMETGLLSLLLVSIFYMAILTNQEPQIKKYLALGILSGLAFLTRPDSILYSFVAIAYISIPYIKTNYKFIQKWKLPALTIAVLAIFVLGSRFFAYVYYGSVLPNTYILKVQGIPLSIRLLNGFRFVLPYLSQTWPLLLLCMMELIFDAYNPKILMGVLPFIAIAYQIFIGGDAFGEWRMMAPTYPFLILMVIFALEALVLALMRTKFAEFFLLRRPLIPRNAIVPFLTVLGLFPALYMVNHPFDREIFGLKQPTLVGDNQDNLNSALAIRAVTCPDATVGVLSGGTLPYYADRQAVDFLGKSDRYIASLPPDLSGAVTWLGMSSVPGHNKYNLYYSIQTLQPTYVQQLSWGTQNLTDWARDHYVKVTYEGISLILLSDSACVNWDLVEIQ